MSNLIKSGFVAFSQDNKLIVDANESKIIKAIDAAADEVTADREASVEEALAEAFIRDAELEGMEFGEDVLTMDTSELSDLSGSGQGLNQLAGKVVRSAKSEAESIVNKAHDEVEQMRAAAYDDAERIKKQAREEGYHAGFEEGMQAARREIQEKSDALDNHLQEAKLQLQQSKAELIKDTEHKMVDLLCQFIPSITGVVIENQRDVLLYMINAAMQDLDNSKHFTVKVAMDDYENVAARRDDIYGALNPNVELEIFEDAKLAPMQCVIETDNGMVDISLDVQLENLITALKLMVKE